MTLPCDNLHFLENINSLQPHDNRLLENLTCISNYPDKMTDIIFKQVQIFLRSLANQFDLASNMWMTSIERRSYSILIQLLKKFNINDLLESTVNTVSRIIKIQNTPQDNKLIINSMYGYLKNNIHTDNFSFQQAYISDEGLTKLIINCAENKYCDISSLQKLFLIVDLLRSHLDKDMAFSIKKATIDKSMLTFLKSQQDTHLPEKIEKGRILFDAYFMGGNEPNNPQNNLAIIKKCHDYLGEKSGICPLLPNDTTQAIEISQVTETTVPIFSTETYPNLIPAIENQTTLFNTTQTGSTFKDLSSFDKNNITFPDSFNSTQTTLDFFPSSHLSTNITLENNATIQNKLNLSNRNLPTLPWGSTLALGISSGFLEHVSQTVRQRAERNHYSPVFLSSLNILLYIMNTVLIGGSAAFLSYIRNPDQNIEMIMVAYSLTINLMLRIVQNIIHAYCRDLLNHHPTCQALLETAPFLGFSLIFSNTQQSILENLGLFGVSYSSSIATKVSLQAVSNRFFKTYPQLKEKEGEQGIELIEGKNASLKSSASSLASQKLPDILDFSLFSSLISKKLQNELNHAWSQLLSLSKAIPNKNNEKNEKQEFFCSLYLIYNYIKEGKTITNLRSNLISTLNTVQEQFRKKLFLHVSRYNKNKCLMSALFDFFDKIREIQVAAQTAELQKNPQVKILLSFNKPLFSSPTSIHSDSSEKFQKQIDEKNKIINQKNKENYPDYYASPKEIKCVTPQNCYYKSR